MRAFSFGFFATHFMPSNKLYKNTYANNLWSNFLQHSVFYTIQETNVSTEQL